MEKQEWKEKYNQYIKSVEWYNLKIDLLQRRGCRCEKCGKRKRPTSLHIHHITYERLFNEIPTDLIILCPLCHAKEHGIIKEKKLPVKKIKPTKKSKRETRKTKQRNHIERQANEKFIAQQRRKHRNYSIYD